MGLPQYLKQQNTERKLSDDFKGHIRFWNGTSYGFIRPDEGDTDIFVHISDFPQGHTIQVGDRVTYRVAADRKRPTRTHAVDVRLA
jgi:CspA family cold shock protein